MLRQALASRQERPADGGGGGGEQRQSNTGLRLFQISSTPVNFELWFKVSGSNGEAQRAVGFKEPNIPKSVCEVFPVLASAARCKLLHLGHQLPRAFTRPSILFSILRLKFQTPSWEASLLFPLCRVLAEILRNSPLVDPRLLSGRDERDRRHCNQCCDSPQIKVKVVLAGDDRGAEQIENYWRRMRRYWKSVCEEHDDRDAAQIKRLANNVLRKRRKLWFHLLV